MSERDTPILVGVLGPLVLRRGDHGVDLGGAKQRTTLAMLALRRNSVVSLDRLIGVLWPHGSPASATANVRTYVSHLRQRLGPFKARLATRSGGYVLELSDSELDLAQFERAHGQADSALRSGDAERAVALYHNALRLWRGEMLEDVSLGPVLRADVESLTTAQIRAREGHLEALLRSGDVSEAQAGLRRLIGDHPLRESAWLLLMKAHVAADDRTAALLTYRRARQELTATLGLEPGAELQALHADILAGSPDSPSPATKGPAEPLVPQQLPRAPAILVGREPELEHVRAVLERRPGTTGPGTQTSGPTIIAVQGSAGIGKSAFALTAAHRAAAAHPDGRLYVDLQGASNELRPLEPGEVLGRFLRALEADVRQNTPQAEEAAARFRSRTAHLNLVIVLDNAVDLEQVRMLLPAGGGCTVLITSRDTLPTLDGVVRVPLSRLSTESAVELLGHHVGAHAVEAQPEVARDIVDLCGRLPLALRVAGVRFADLPPWRLPYIAERLRDEQRRLDELGTRDLDVRSSFEAGYRALLTDRQGHTAARLFRRLGALHLFEVTPFVAAALVETDEMMAFRLLGLLARHGLLEESGTVYRMHDLLRLFAAERAREKENTSETGSALVRVARRYTDLIRSNAALRLPTGDGVAQRFVGPRTVDEANTWILGHMATLSSLVRQLAQDPARLHLAFELLHALHRRLVVLQPAECVRLCTPLLAGADRAGENELAAEVECILANAHLSLRQFDDMATRVDEALGRLPDIRNDRIRARVLAVAGSAELHHGAPERANAHLFEALALQEHHKRWKAVGVICHDIARSAMLRDDHEAGLRLLRRSLRLSREHNDLLDTAQVHESLSRVHLRREEREEAIGHAEAAVDITERTGHLAGHASALRTLGTVLWWSEDERAHTVLSRADALAESLRSAAERP